MAKKFQEVETLIFTNLLTPCRCVYERIMSKTKPLQWNVSNQENNLIDFHFIRTMFGDLFPGSICTHSSKFIFDNLQIRLESLENRPLTFTIIDYARILHQTSSAVILICEYLPYHAQHYNTIIQNNNDSKFSKFLLGLKLIVWSTSAFIIILSSSLFSSKCSPKTGSNFSSLWHRPCLDDKVITCDFALHRHEASRVGNLHPVHLNINHGKPCKRSKCVPILCLWLCRCPDGQNKEDNDEGINLFETKPKQSIGLHISKIVFEWISSCVLSITYTW